MWFLRSAVSVLGVVALVALSAPAARALSPADAADAVLTRCTVGAATGWVSGCDGGELVALRRAVDDAGTDQALLTLAALLSSSDKARRALGAAELQRVHDNPSWTGVVKPETADALLDAAEGLPPFAQSQALPAVARAAVLAGRTEAAVARLDGLGAASLAAAAEGLLTQGDPAAGLALLDHRDERVVAAVLEGIAALTPRAVKRLRAGCERAAPLVGSPSSAVAHAALSAAASCGGEAASSALSAARSRRAAGDIPVAFVRALGELCADRTGPGCPGAAAMLVDIIEDEAVHESSRVEGVWTLYFARPDAATASLARRLGTDDGALGAAARAVGGASAEAGEPEDEADADAGGDEADAGGDEADEADDADADSDAESDVDEDSEEEADTEARPRVSYSGKWSGSLSGGGSVKFTVRGSSVSGATARVGGVSLPLRGKLRGSKLHLTGRRFTDYIAVTGRLRANGKGSGSFQGGVAKKAVSGSWSAARR